MKNICLLVRCARYLLIGTLGESIDAQHSDPNGAEFSTSRCDVSKAFWFSSNCHSAEFQVVNKAIVPRPATYD